MKENYLFKWYYASFSLAAKLTELKIDSTFFSSFLNLYPLRTVFSCWSYEVNNLSQNFPQPMFGLWDAPLTAVQILARLQTLHKNHNLCMSTSLLKPQLNSPKIHVPICGRGIMFSSLVQLLIWKISQKLFFPCSWFLSSQWWRAVEEEAFWR